MKIERIEPTQLPNGLWLNGNEYASENVEESAGVLSLATGETEGYRVSPALDVGAITGVDSSKLEWTSTGDVEVLAAVSEVSAKGSLRGDGEDDSVIVSHSPELDVTDMTVSFWIKRLGSFSDLTTALGRPVSTGPIVPYRAYFSTFLRAFVFSFFDGATRDVGDQAGVYTNQDVWYHYIGTLLQVGNDVHAAFYRDNVLVDSAVFSSASVPVRTSDFFMFSEDSRRYSNVALSDVRLYNRVVSESERADIFAGKPVMDGIKLWSPCDDRPGSDTARDISGNNNNGTIIGASYSPDNPLLQAATNGQAIPGVSPGDNLTGKKLYMQQRLARTASGDPSPTLTELTATVRSAGGVPYSILTYGGWI